MPPGEKAAILGAIAGAQHVRLMAKHYGIPVVLHRSDLVWALSRMSSEPLVYFCRLLAALSLHLVSPPFSSDHCAKKLLPWFDGMLEANEEYFK